MQEELLAARGPHPRDQIRPPVLAPLILGLQDFDHLAVHAKQVPGQIGGQALEGIAADDVLDGHGRRLTRPRGVEKSRRGNQGQTRVYRSALGLPFPGASGFTGYEAPAHDPYR